MENSTEQFREIYYCNKVNYINTFWDSRKTQDLLKNFHSMNFFKS